MPHFNSPLGKGESDSVHLKDMSPRRPGLLASLSLLLAAPGIALGQASPPGREVIPDLPSRPPQLTQEAPPLLFSCQRRLLWKGQEIPCDSPLYRDAENLRPILSPVPQAETQLDAYQRTRREVRRLAYVGGAGLLLVVSSFIVPGWINSSQTQNSVRYGLLGVGSFIAFSSFFYGLGSLDGNEVKLANAIDSYNAAAPQGTIEWLGEKPGSLTRPTLLTAGGIAAVLIGAVLPKGSPQERGKRTLKYALIGGGLLTAIGGASYSLGFAMNDDFQGMRPQLAMNFHF